MPLLLFWALFDQSSSRWIFQASHMDRHVPGFVLQPDQIPALNPLMIIVLIPLFSHGIYPGLRKCGCDMTPLRRMRYGLFLSGVSFAVAGGLQIAIHHHTVHVGWQIPQYLIISCAEIMVSITGLEFAYTEAPASMKSAIMAAWFITVALGNFLVALIAELRMFDAVSEYFFYAVLMALGTLWFWYNEVNYPPASSYSLDYNSDEDMNDEIN
eukprot:GFYU01028229.1.p1 GENE.GFYU01028229.1~~GFYU01028229.1.p1  ORF type:complete len:212 (-),score=48.22 GFYU01028229.1:97-732(-)